MSDIFSLKNKSFVVTGGTGILGKAFVEAIAAEGGNVGILGRNKVVAEERADAIVKAGGHAIPLIADINDEAALSAAKDEMVKKFGSVDGLVNGAGGNIPEAVVQPEDDIFSLDMQALGNAVKLNLWGTVLPTQIFGREIARKGAGSIVNISSLSASKALTRVLGYSLGKSAIDCYTRWMAVELANRYGDAVRMNAIMPGFFLTEQNRTLLTNEDNSYTARGNLIVQHTPFKRMGQADELKGTLIWLLSDASRFVTGTIIAVDGGFSAFSGV
ncbi:SDR family oxidoreductase [Ferruginibacter sp. HRS2-29]|uniref:SDR family oxidoreductase n=1 Tax=Ferruginibacter sp. HRS2-29 TaxID=2487334 RepID=UPI0020CE4233|nr:SDR family oxidoreductase [Ferruginibacter sp. HRS2-29]MCP9749394.1 SDR family oxidoreductase [Ferruginibacter sp. HRS2-29]